MNVLVPGSQPQPRAVRLIGHGLGLTAFLVFVACLIVPTLSSYKILLSPAAFAFGVIGLYAPLLLRNAVTLVGREPSFLRTLTSMADGNESRFAAVTGFWKRHEVTLERGAALAGLAAMAIAQPIFEVVSNSPEFLRPGGRGPRTALRQYVAICFGVPLVLRRNRARDSRGQPRGGYSVSWPRVGAAHRSHRDAVVPARLTCSGSPRDIADERPHREPSWPSAPLETARSPVFHRTRASRPDRSGALSPRARHRADDSCRHHQRVPCRRWNRLRQSCSSCSMSCH